MSADLEATTRVPGVQFHRTGLRRAPKKYREPKCGCRVVLRRTLEIHASEQYAAPRDLPAAGYDRVPILTAVGPYGPNAPFEGRWEIGLSVLVLTGLVVAMTLSIFLGAQSNRTIAALKHAEQTKLLATDLLLDLRRAESSQRGYLLTGNTIYLRGYKVGLTDLPLAIEVRHEGFFVKTPTGEQNPQAADFSVVQNNSSAIHPCRFGHDRQAEA